MKIAIIGPTHPYKGGIALHTTQLAYHLTEAGHDVKLISWRTQYPFFYPGQQYVPENKPEIPPFPHTSRVLSWKNPAGWWRQARRLRGFDKVIFVWWVPTVQGPVYLSMLRAFGKRRPYITVICHNVLPHEARPGDKRLARSVLSQADRIIVHAETQADLAHGLSNTRVEVASLPFSMPILAPKPARRPAIKRQLLFFGIVRPYKGLDVLLKAIGDVPDVQLTVAGEFWGDTEKYDRLLAKHNLKKRVFIRNEYVPADELASLISTCDAVVLPYKHGTATWNATLAFAYGKPVIATTAGSLTAAVTDNVNGLLCKPGDAKSLAAAIRHFYEPGIAEKLRGGVPTINTGAEWAAYIATIIKN